MITEQIKWPIILTFTFSSSSPLLQGKQKRLQLAELISEGDCSHSSQQLDHFSGSNAFIHSFYFLYFYTAPVCLKTPKHFQRGKLRSH